jgi:hypothetical protein
MKAPRRTRARSFYERAMTAAERDALDDALVIEGLDEEVALLRLRLRSLLAESDADERLIQAGIRLLLQALATRHRIEGRHVEELGSILAPEEAARG